MEVDDEFLERLGLDLLLVGAGAGADDDDDDRFFRRCFL